MYSSIQNTEWDSNFWTLSFRCFVSWTARKLTNASVINSVTDTCIFQVNITVFKDFSRLFHTYDHFKTFLGLDNFYIKFQDFPYFSRICTNPACKSLLCQPGSSRWRLHCATTDSSSRSSRWCVNVCRSHILCFLTRCHMTRWRWTARQWHRCLFWICRLYYTQYP